MADKPFDSPEQMDLEEKTLGQRLFDNMYVLLILSLLISFVLYNVWGLVETLNVPPAP